MTNEHQQTSIFAKVLFRVLTVLTLYLLSVGPAKLAARRWPATQDAYEWAYIPVDLLMEISICRRPLDWYLRLWGPGC